jgi:hypothetical protein
MELLINDINGLMDRFPHEQADEEELSHIKVWRRQLLSYFSSDLPAQIASGALVETGKITAAGALGLASKY